MLSYQYSRNLAPKLIEIKQGRFLTHEEWVASWQEEEEEEEEEDDDDDDDDDDEEAQEE